MVRAFYLLSGLLVAMVMMMGLHYFFSGGGRTTEEIDHIAALSHLASPSLSVAWYEPELHGTERAGNCAYPEMMPIDRMDFVYAK